MTQRLLWPLTRLGETLDLYQRAMASCRRIFGLLEVRAHDPARRPRAGRCPCAGAVRFEGVRFAYGTGAARCCAASTSTSPPGETHAIVGSTGAGKSTVVKLLLRLYEPTGGPHHARRRADRPSSPFRSLRGAIGFVAQDVFLFQGTVRENLTYGRPDATDDEVRAGRHAGRGPRVHHDAAPTATTRSSASGARSSPAASASASRWPGRSCATRPSSCSTRPRRRSTTRPRPPSSGRSSACRPDRTTIVIAHRLSTVRHAHRIHVLEAGRVIEAGTHEELVEHGGLYAALWRVQTGELSTAQD